MNVLEYYEYLSSNTRYAELFDEQMIKEYDNRIKICDSLISQNFSEDYISLSKTKIDEKLWQQSH